MPKVKLTSEFKVEIPQAVRDRLGLNPGREYKVHLHGDHIILTPVRDPEEDLPFASVRGADWAQKAEC